MEASGYPDDDSLTPDDREFLNDAYERHQGAIEGILGRWRRGMSMQPTIERILGFLNGVYHYGLAINGMNDDDLYEWVFGDTVEHCADCAGSVSKGPMPGEYWKAQAAAGIYPGSPALECTGLHCLCQLEEA